MFFREDSEKKEAPHSHSIPLDDKSLPRKEEKQESSNTESNPFHTMVASPEMNAVLKKFRKGEIAHLINKKGHDGSTPLHIAVETENTEAVDILLKKGANPTINKNGDYTTAIDLAISKKNLKLLEIFTSKKSKSHITPRMVYDSAEQGDLTLFKILVDPAHPNLPLLNAIPAYWTPLHIAAANGHVSIIKHSLELKTNVNVTVGDELTPLYLAIDNSQAEAAIALLNAKANADIACEGISPLMLAITRGQQRIITLLTQPGRCNLNQQDNEGMTAFMYAAREKDFATMKLLLDNFADATILDKKNKNALDYLKVDSTEWSPEQNRIIQQLQKAITLPPKPIISTTSRLFSKRKSTMPHISSRENNKVSKHQIS